MSIIRELHCRLGLRPNFHCCFQFFDCCFSGDHAVTNLLLGSQNRRQKRGVNNALGYEGATQRQTTLDTYFESLIELVRGNNQGIDQQFTQSIGRAALVRMVNASQCVFEGLAVSGCHTQRFDADFYRDYPVTY